MKYTVIISVAGFKGGIAKTTTAVHLAAYFQEKGPTLLVDGDPNRSALKWGERAEFSFEIIPLNAAEEYARKGRYKYIIFDTKAREGTDEMLELARGTDILILPTEVGSLSLDGLIETLRALTDVKTKYKVLLTKTPPVRTGLVKGERTLIKNKKVLVMREHLAANGIPVWDTEIQLLAVFSDSPDYGCLAKDFQGAMAQKAWEMIRSLGAEIEKETENG